MHFRDPKSVKGGVGGIGKSARTFLRQISEGSETFDSVFNIRSGKFVIARKDGKKQFKTCLYRYGPNITFCY